MYSLFDTCIHVHVLQLSEYQQKLSEAQSELSQLRSQLATLEESKEKLQEVLDDCSSQERQKENQIKLLQAQLTDKSEQLSAAEDKIQVHVYVHVKDLIGAHLYITHMKPTFSAPLKYGYLCISDQDAVMRPI